MNKAVLEVRKKGEGVFAGRRKEGVGESRQERKENMEVMERRQRAGWKGEEKGKRDHGEVK